MSMFQSSWGQPQNQQQQQQQPQQSGGFGQSAFGSTGTSTFGNAGTFGQPAQPQTTAVFGSNPPAGTGTFGTGGAFGSTANNASAFGAKPSTGFGAFSGGTSAFGGGTTTFGQPANNASTSGTNGGLFGQPSNSTAASNFGTSSLFASKPANAFSTTPTAPSTSFPSVTTGSSNPPFAIHVTKEASNGNLPVQYMAISCMPAYVGYSFEELRVQDYAQGRKTANSFSQPNAFGSAPQQTTSIFGATQPAQQNPQPSIFGGGTTNTNTMDTGSSGGFGAFGSNTNTANQGTTGNTSLFGGTSTFGQQPQQQNQGTGFGIFGQPSQQQQQQQPQQQQQQPTTGLFGNNNTTNTFGANANKPAFGAFGATTTGTGGFGTGNAFGTQQQQQPSTQPTTGLFGNQQPATTNTGFGAFGAGTNNNTNATKPLFGSTTPTTQPTNTFSLFGTQQQQQQPQQQNQQQPQQSSIFGGGGNLFGANNNAQQQQPQQGAQPTSSLFGGTTATQPTTGTGLFGGGGLFGNNQQQQQQQQPQTGQAGFGLFGQNKPQTTSNPMFGGGLNQQTATSNQPQQSTNLFGSTLGQSTNQSNMLGGGSLFGPKPPTLGTSTSGQGGGLFGSTLGNSMATLNNSTNTTGGTLQASISEPIGSNLPIFSLLPPGPRAVNLEQSPKKKTGFFVDIPTRSPVPRVQLGYTPANSKLRGFGSTTLSSSTLNGNPFSTSLVLTGGKSIGLGKTSDRAGPLGSDGLIVRSSSPLLGSGGRQSVKKVILDKRVEPSELFVKSASPGSLRGKVTFSPALSVAAREKDAAAATAPQNLLASPVVATPTKHSPNRFTAQGSSKDLIGTDTNDADASALEEGDYYSKPDLSTLKKAGYDQLSSFPDLIVGRVGYGEIRFLEPVDLTGLPKLGALLGDVIRFGDKECSVYPDSEDADKPPPGSGLNVKAKIVLERCWPSDKATREPIKDATHPSAVKNLKRLKNMRDTHFESFDNTAGKWTFTVDHF